MEGPLEGLVADPRAAKGDAANVSLRVLQRSPSGTCVHAQTLGQRYKQLHVCGSSTLQHTTAVATMLEWKDQVCLVQCTAYSCQESGDVLTATASTRKTLLLQGMQPGCA